MQAGHVLATLGGVEAQELRQLGTVLAIAVHTLKKGENDELRVCFDTFTLTFSSAALCEYSGANKSQL